MVSSGATSNASSVNPPSGLKRSDMWRKFLDRNSSIPALLILSILKILSKTKTKENYEMNMRTILGTIAAARTSFGCSLADVWTV